MEKTLLVILPGREIMQDSLFSILIAKTGEALADHYCSNSTFAYGDLYGNRKERIEEWTKRFGKLEVKFLDETNITEKELLKRNKQWYENEQNKTT